MNGRRPVVFFFASRALTPFSSVKALVTSIRTAMAGMGFDVYLIGDEYDATVPPDPVKISTWDGIFGFDADLGMGGFADDNGLLDLRRRRHDEYEAAAQLLRVDSIPSLTPGFNDRAIRRTSANNPARARRTNARALEGSFFLRFFRDIALPHAQHSRLKTFHIATFNE